MVDTLACTLNFPGTRLLTLRQPAEHLGCVALQTEEKVWSRSREFRVTASSSARKWNVNVNDTDATVGRAGHVDYVPTYQEAQLFKWRGYWVEIRRNKGQLTYNPAMGQQVVSSMYLTWVIPLNYTLAPNSSRVL